MASETPNHVENELESTYKSMKQRCLNPNNKDYMHYGGRGITVCDQWQGKSGFSTFVLDMGVRPEGYTLDRIDNNGNYEPGNCRWATRKEQASNRRFDATPRRNNKSGILGVSWSKPRRKWVVQFKGVYLGLFTDKEQASLQYITARNTWQKRSK